MYYFDVWFPCFFGTPSVSSSKFSLVSVFAQLPVYFVMLAFGGRYEYTQNWIKWAYDNLTDYSYLCYDESPTQAWMTVDSMNDVNATLANGRTNCILEHQIMRRVCWISTIVAIFFAFATLIAPSFSLRRLVMPMAWFGGLCVVLSVFLTPDSLYGPDMKLEAGKIVSSDPSWKQFIVTWTGLLCFFFTFIATLRLAGQWSGAWSSNTCGTISTYLFSSLFFGVSLFVLTAVAFPTEVAAVFAMVLPADASTVLGSVISVMGKVEDESKLRYVPLIQSMLVLTLFVAGTVWLCLLTKTCIKAPTMLSLPILYLSVLTLAINVPQTTPFSVSWMWSSSAWDDEYSRSLLRFSTVSASLLFIVGAMFATITETRPSSIQFAIFNVFQLERNKCENKHFEYITIGTTSKEEEDSVSRGQTFLWCLYLATTPMALLALATEMQFLAPTEGDKKTIK